MQINIPDEGNKSPISDQASKENENLKTLVKEIIQSGNKIHKLKNNNKRTKWSPENSRIFVKLYHMFSGDLDMVHTYFLQHTDYKFTKQQIKKKYVLEMHNLHRINDQIDFDLSAKLFDICQYNHLSHSLEENSHCEFMKSPHTT